MKTRFGIFVPHGWRMELAALLDPSAQWAAVLDTATEAEALGYDSLWVYDHLHTVADTQSAALYESWTVLSALSQRTNRVRLGTLVGCLGYRNPALMAKMAATLDVISDGRLEFGIGAGWHRAEHEAYGFPFRSTPERIDRLRSAVSLIRSMWTQESTTFESSHDVAVQARCDPKPIQRPHPPILIGGGGERRLLRVVAEVADRSNFGGSPATFAHKRGVLRAHCEDVGRDHEDIDTTWSGDLLVAQSERDLRAFGTRSLWGQSFDAWREANLVGTPGELVDKVAAYLDSGATTFIMFPVDAPRGDSFRRFADQVMPAFTAQEVAR